MLGLQILFVTNIFPTSVGIPLKGGWSSPFAQRFLIYFERIRGYVRFLSVLSQFQEGV